jgi:hypothetical protein
MANPPERAGRAPFLPGKEGPAKERVHRFLQNPQNIKKFLRTMTKTVLKSLRMWSSPFRGEGKKISLYDFPYGTIQEITERF